MSHYSFIILLYHTLLLATPKMWYHGKDPHCCQRTNNKNPQAFRSITKVKSLHILLELSWTEGEEVWHLWLCRLWTRRWQGRSRTGRFSWLLDDRLVPFQLYKCTIFDLYFSVVEEEQVTFTRATVPLTQFSRGHLVISALASFVKIYFMRVHLLTTADRSHIKLLFIKNIHKPVAKLGKIHAINWHCVRLPERVHC